VSTILDHFTYPEQFKPKTIEQLLALRICQKLNDLENLRAYLVLFEHHPKELLIGCYQKAIAKGGSKDEFFAVLRSITQSPA